MFNQLSNFYSFLLTKNVYFNIIYMLNIVAIEKKGKKRRKLDGLFLSKMFSLMLYNEMNIGFRLMLCYDVVIT